MAAYPDQSLLKTLRCCIVKFYDRLIIVVMRVLEHAHRGNMTVGQRSTCVVNWCFNSTHILLGMISFKLVVALIAAGGLVFFLVNQKFVNEVPPNYDTILETGERSVALKLLWTAT